MTPEQAHEAAVDKIAQVLVAMGCEVATYRNAGRVIGSLPNGTVVSVGIKTRTENKERT